MSVGSKIKALRKKRGMTQQTLSEGIITRSMLSRIESGSATPSMQSLTEISKRLDVSPSYLVDDDDDIMPAEYERIAKSIETEFCLGNYATCLDILSMWQFEHNKKFTPIFATCAFEMAKTSFLNGDFKYATQMIEKIYSVLPTILISPPSVTKKRLDFVINVMQNIDNIDAAIEAAYDMPDFEFSPSLFFSLLKLLRNSRHEDCIRLLEFCELEPIYKSYIDAQIMIRDYKFIDAILLIKSLLADDSSPVFLKLLCLNASETCSKLCQDYKSAYENHIEYQKVLNSIRR